MQEKEPQPVTITLGDDQAAIILDPEGRHTVAIKKTDIIGEVELLAVGIAMLLDDPDWCHRLCLRVKGKLNEIKTGDT